MYYGYDEAQDMLYITFNPEIGGTYYEDIEGVDGVMLRYGGDTEEVVGITVHNVKQKMLRMFRIFAVLLQNPYLKKNPLPKKNIPHIQYKIKEFTKNERKKLEIGCIWNRVGVAGKWDRNCIGFF